jgi:hypothetical protein
LTDRREMRMGAGLPMELNLLDIMLRIRLSQREPSPPSAEGEAWADERSETRKCEPAASQTSTDERYISLSPNT